ncbi:MAG: MMPL family transporter [Candidatus Thermoplasmatota archaeon]
MSKAKAARSVGFLDRSLSSLARASARHRVPVLLVTALLMGTLAFGIPRLTFEERLEDALPTGDPHTFAAQNLTRSFPGAAYASPVFVTVDPSKWEAANAQLPNRVPLGAAPGSNSPSAVNDAFALLDQLTHQVSGGAVPAFPDPLPGPSNITDEVYMRGQTELVLFLQERVPELAWAITLESQVRLVNYTNTGIPGPSTAYDAPPVRAPDAAAFTMPGTDRQGAQQYSAAWTTYFLSSPASVRSIASPDWSSTRLAFLFEPGEASIITIGHDLDRAVAAYRTEVERCDAGQGCTLTWNVFRADAILVDPRAPTAAASHLTAVTLDDLRILTPVAVLLVGAFLFLQFRRPGTVLAMVIPLGVSGLGVLGAFGLLGIPIHSVSLLVFPVLIGTGIDFGIHMAASFHEARGRGKSPLDAAAAAGHGAGVPLVVVTITTLAGMLFLLLAPNRLLQQLGLSITIGLSLLLLVSLTALPAALSWTRAPPPRLGPLDRFLERNAAFWGSHRTAAIGLVVLLAAGGLFLAPQLKTLVVGTPAAYYPEDDPQRQDFDRSNDLYFRSREDLVTNVLVVEGDLTSPASMALLKDLEGRVRELPFVTSDSAVSIHFAMNAWIQVRQGTAGAPAVIAQESSNPGSTFPTTQAGIRFVLDEMFATPLANYISFFIDPDYRISVLLVELDQPSDFSQLESRWNELNRIIRETQADHPAADLAIHASGATAVAYLFTAKELPYLQIAGLVGLAFTALQILLLRRSVRDALTVTLVVVAAGAWWLGLLQLSAIPLSIALVVPVVILEAIGSDYALHLRYGLASEGPRAWGTVGRAVFFAAITDIAAFLVFTFLKYELLAQATLATVYVLLCAGVATLVLVPALARRSELPPPAPGAAS